MQTTALSRPVDGILERGGKENEEKLSCTPTNSVWDSSFLGSHHEDFMREMLNQFTS